METKKNEIDLHEEIASIFECCVCLGPFNNPVRSKFCGHLFCAGCVEQFVPPIHCPTCRHHQEKESFIPDNKKFHELVNNKNIGIDRRKLEIGDDELDVIKQSTQTIRNSFTSIKDELVKQEETCLDRLKVHIDFLDGDNDTQQQLATMGNNLGKETLRCFDKIFTLIENYELFKSPKFDRLLNRSIKVTLSIDRGERSQSVSIDHLQSFDELFKIVLKANPKLFLIIPKLDQFIITIYSADEKICKMMIPTQQNLFLDKFRKIANNDKIVFNYQNIDNIFFYDDISNRCFSTYSRLRNHAIYNFCRIKLYDCRQCQISSICSHCESNCHKGHRTRVFRVLHRHTKTIECGCMNRMDGTNCQFQKDYSLLNYWKIDERVNSTE
ncbi:hypothetical protein SNEBB_010980 [Seison nebaliae]|nr:hypothetical protein SNEBB_010980 [Seison nebaliae]